MLAVLLRGDPTRGRGSPEDAGLAREVDIHGDGGLSGYLSPQLTVMEDGHPHTRESQRDQSWVAGREQGLV